MRSVDRLPAEVRAAAKRILAYLAECDPRDPSGTETHVDAIIGFGVFDLRLPRFCGELLTEGFGDRIIFTGGCGAGTGNLGGPEAEVWREELRRSHPQISDAQVIVENRSTNTAENIRFVAELLPRVRPEWTFGGAIRSAALVASPSRLRRAWLTMRQLHPAVRTVRRLPPFSFDGERELYAQNGVDYIAHLLGEVDRLVQYPAKGWIAPEPVPLVIAAAAAALRGASAKH